MDVRGPHEQHYLRILKYAFGHFRKKRIQYVFQSFQINSGTDILDVGGTAFFWKLAQEMGLPTPHVTIVNVIPAPESLPSNIEWIVADGSELPFTDRTFDMVFCNSVIEHVGTKRNRMAQEIMRVAPKYFVQTPSKWFPIEPHLMTPFIHWIPVGFRPRLIRRFTVWGLLKHPNAAECQGIVDEIDLMSTKNVRELFPTGRVVVERFCGFPKSILVLGDQQQRSGPLVH